MENLTVATVRLSRGTVRFTVATVRLSIGTVRFTVATVRLSRGTVKTSFYTECSVPSSTGKA